MSGWSATRLEKWDGNYKMQAEKHGTEDWRVTIRLSGVVVATSIALKTPGDAFDWAEDEVVRQKREAEQYAKEP